jgi:release factor glutamine methyltransferase
MTVAGASVAAPRVRDVLASANKALGSASEARWIVVSAAGVRAGDLVLRLDTAVTPAVADAVRRMVDRRLSGEPLQYVLGSWAFRTLEIGVDRRALIPRPETEQVVEVALEELSAQARRVPRGSPLVVVDLGTGSGAIALSLAAEFFTAGPSLEVWATDVSVDALELCRQNLAVLAGDNPEAASRVRAVRGRWFDALADDLAGQVRLAVSNPPYVSQAEWEALDPTVRDHEPFGALVPGPTGLEAIESVLEQATRWLAPGGSLVVELAPGQSAHVTDRAAALGYVGATIRDDLAGRKRILVARSPGG